MCIRSTGIKRGCSRNGLEFSLYYKDWRTKKRRSVNSLFLWVIVCTGVRCLLDRLSASWWNSLCAEIWGPRCPSWSIRIGGFGQTAPSIWLQHRCRASTRLCGRERKTQEMGLLHPSIQHPSIHPSKEASKMHSGVSPASNPDKFTVLRKQARALARCPAPSHPLADFPVTRQPVTLRRWVIFQELHTWQIGFTSCGPCATLSALVHACRTLTIRLSQHLGELMSTRAGPRSNPACTTCSTAS